jgi:hypothetical protein
MEPEAQWPGIRSPIEQHILDKLHQLLVNLLIHIFQDLCTMAILTVGAHVLHKCTSILHQCKPDTKSLFNACLERAFVIIRRNSNDM